MQFFKHFCRIKVHTEQIHHFKFFRAGFEKSLKHVTPTDVCRESQNCTWPQGPNERILEAFTGVLIVATSTQHRQTKLK